ncbi:MAG: hypothetical protein WCJ09_03570 [Planctomycetota bacterium]
MRTQYCILLTGTLLFVGGLRAETPPAGVPKEVVEASDKTGKWINSLKGKSNEQIVSELGKPTERLTWTLNGKSELKLRYTNLLPKSTLELYFTGDRVITASLQVLSN